MAAESLNVIALISGGKDSFFSALHCIARGHKVVALANLYPPSEGSEHNATTQVIGPDDEIAKPQSLIQDENDNETDLNSFMYQTVGHEVIPLYAAATGLPLFRQPILGGAAHHERDYAYDGLAQDADETESMIPLLERVMQSHPEANALCSGAILSTYQRTRVESIALRLGLTPLSYLWKYPVLPSPSTSANESQLLLDMEAAGLQARIIKVASAGLDEDYLWRVASSTAGATQIRNALRKFGAEEGAALGEGGEFETLVVDGPASIFKRAVAVPDDGQRIIREGGGSSWLMLRGAYLQEKTHDDSAMGVREPDLLDARFKEVLDTNTHGLPRRRASDGTGKLSKAVSGELDQDAELFHWTFIGNDASGGNIQQETSDVVTQIGQKLVSLSISADTITAVTIVLRRMADFPKVNAEYGKLFTRPNPPSRVTISSGDLLPQGSNIMVHVTLPTSMERGRDGLHVQSRSYWAPANIGPYSQAIEIPSSASPDSKLKLSYIAGQIPLIPSTMALPTSGPSALQLQTVLSLQHLWRIGAERGIQYWTSGVAYFAKTDSTSEMERNAKLADQAWRTIHAPVDEDDESSGPDPWDLKYNPEYISLAGAEESTAKPPLPDWSAFSMRQQNEPDACTPPMFAVEVEELPRQSAVEWHAHIGLSKIDEAKAEVAIVPETAESSWRAWHILVREPGSVFIHTVLSRKATNGSGLKDELAKAYSHSLTSLDIDLPTVRTEPYLTYLDCSSRSLDVNDCSFAVVPCRSIWSEEGRLQCVAVFKTTLRVTNN